MTGRAHQLGVWQFDMLDLACRRVHEAYGSAPFLVGSCLSRRDWRDVDVRLVLDDAGFDARFPGARADPHRDPLWRLVCGAVSEQLSRISGLPVDFQIQPRSAADLEGGPRIALGASAGPPFT